MDEELDYRFSLANERTYLAWIRTALALVAAGVVAAKALNFEHEVVRWIVAIPPLVAGAALAVAAGRQERRYDAAMRAGRKLPEARWMRGMGAVLGLYAVVALVAIVLD